MNQISLDCSVFEEAKLGFCYVAWFREPNVAARLLVKLVLWYFDGILMALAQLEKRAGMKFVSLLTLEDEVSFALLCLSPILQTFYFKNGFTLSCVT